MMNEWRSLAQEWLGEVSNLDCHGMVAAITVLQEAFTGGETWLQQVHNVAWTLF